MESQATIPFKAAHGAATRGNRHRFWGPGQRASGPDERMIIPIDEPLTNDREEFARASGLVIVLLTLLMAIKPLALHLEALPGLSQKRAGKLVVESSQPTTPDPKKLLHRKR